MRFTKDHEWVELAGDVATVGVTAYAANQLGDIVFVELPEVGRTVAPGEGFAVVESVKAASDVYAPISGVVTEVNEDAQGAGWFAKIRVSDPAQLDALMDQAAYDKLTEGL